MIFSTFQHNRVFFYGYFASNQAFPGQSGGKMGNYQIKSTNYRPLKGHTEPYWVPPTNDLSFPVPKQLLLYHFQGVKWVIIRKIGELSSPEGPKPTEIGNKWDCMVKLNFIGHLPLLIYHFRPLISSFYTISRG